MPFLLFFSPSSPNPATFTSKAFRLVAEQPYKGKTCVQEACSTLSWLDWEDSGLLEVGAVGRFIGTTALFPSPTCCYFSGFIGLEALWQWQMSPCPAPGDVCQDWELLWRGGFGLHPLLELLELKCSPRPAFPILKVLTEIEGWNSKLPGPEITALRCCWAPGLV